ncbi:MAG: hypothetical protein D6826_07640 [Alphaproteobacteria bacterium]|nr:MAG: hypothetical protein D6826_07640 [Alphaproteobacteria bacterium]
MRGMTPCPQSVARAPSPCAPSDCDVAFEVSAADVADALARLEQDDALALPLIGPRLRHRLLRAAARLAFRPAQPVIGEGANAVYQEFDLCTAIPARSPFRAVAGAFTDLLAAALGHLDPPPLAQPPVFNDLIVQRYARGALGITPHRDHIRYRGLIALVTLCGAARFHVCADRAGSKAREIPAPAGSVVLMRAPDFAGRPDRPFHFLCDVTARRISFGLRHDARMPAAARAHIPPGLT